MKTGSSPFGLAAVLFCEVATAAPAPFVAEEAPALSYTAVYGTDPGDVIVVGTSGAVFHSTGSGSWAQSYLPGAGYLTALCGDYVGHLVVGNTVPGHGASATVFTSDDDGVHFSAAASVGYNGVNALGCAGNGSAVYLAYDAGLRVSGDLGHAFSEVPIDAGGGARQFVSVWVAPDGSEVFALGRRLGAAGLLIAHSGDGGATFTSHVEEGLDPGFGGIASDNLGHAWAVGGPLLLSSPDDGASWDVQVLDGGASLRGVWVDPDGGVYAVGADGLALYADDGVHFAPLSLPTTNSLQAVWGTASNDVYIVGNGVILHGQQ